MWFRTLLIFSLFCSPLWGEEGATLPGDGGQRIREEIDQSHRLAGEGKIDDAISKLGSLLKSLPEQSYLMQIQYDLANLLFLQGRYPEARAAYFRVVMLGEDQKQMVARSKERIEKMKEKESSKGDDITIRLIDIETSLDAGQLPPEGSRQFLKEIESQPAHPSAEKARRLRLRIRETENAKALLLLNEARALFDKRKDYAKVLSILEAIKQEFPNTDEMTSVEILMEMTKKRLGRRAGSTD
ncbi:MAG: tetratricopeptide repeat protein [Deltaproteobacteria bacterium]|nr:tetratricopeptide repeat protein [Deltaproteobacteria bacterium]MBI4374210.1 tetratricopeptide repeat protein [Deltaproteobacteria bacterium]